MEHDGLIDAVQELWTEVILQCVVDLVLHALIRHCFITLSEANIGLAQILCAEV